MALACGSGGMGVGWVDSLSAPRPNGMAVTTVRGCSTSGESRAAISFSSALAARNAGLAARALRNDSAASSYRPKPRYINPRL